MMLLLLRQRDVLNDAGIELSHINVCVSDDGKGDTLHGRRINMIDQAIERQKGGFACVNSMLQVLLFTWGQEIVNEVRYHICKVLTVHEDDVRANVKNYRFFMGAQPVRNCIYEYILGFAEILWVDEYEL